MMATLGAGLGESALPELEAWQLSVGKAGSYNHPSGRQDQTPDDLFRWFDGVIFYLQWR